MHSYTNISFTLIAFSTRKLFLTNYFLKRILFIHYVLTIFRTVMEVNVLH